MFWVVTPIAVSLLNYTVMVLFICCVLYLTAHLCSLVAFYCLCPMAKTAKGLFSPDRVKDKLLIGRSSGVCNNLLIQKISWSMSGSVEQVTCLLHWSKASVPAPLLNTTSFITKRDPPFQVDSLLSACLEWSVRWPGLVCLGHLLDLLTLLELCFRGAGWHLLHLYWSPFTSQVQLRQIVRSSFG